MATYWENSCSFGLRYVSWYKYLIVSLVFSHLGFWSGNLFLIAPFPDLCLLVPFCNHVTDFNARKECLTAKLLQQGYRYHKLRKAFSKFYHRHYELISKLNVGLKALLREAVWNILVTWFTNKKPIGRNDFSIQLRKIIITNVSDMM